MKKTTILMAAALTMMVGCNKSQTVPSTENTQTFSVSVSIKDNASKTAFGTQVGNEIPVLWQVGDKINVNGQESNALEQGGQANATFEFTSAVGGTLNTIYPASAMKSYAEGSAVVTLPATQAFVENGYDPAAALLAGKGEEGEVALGHLMAYLKVTPLLGTENVKIKSIELNSFGGQLCGDFDTDFETMTAAQGNTGYRVSMTPAEPVALGTPFIFAIPAREYKDKIEMTITDENDNFMKVTSTFTEAQPLVATAGHLLPTSVTYAHYEDMPENLYMLGDGTPGGWGSTTKLDGNGAGVYTIEGVSLSGGNFKIYPEDPQTSGNWAPYYGASTSATADNISIEKVPSDSAPERNFNIERWGFTAGVYNVTVNLNTMKITFEKLNLRTIYLYGACFNGKDDWSYWCPLLETGNNTDIYKATVDLMANDNWRGFKIYRTMSDWSNEYCCDWGKSINGDINNVYFDHKDVTGDNQIYPYSFNVPNGLNVVTVDFNTKKVSFAPAN